MVSQIFQDKQDLTTRLFNKQNLNSIKQEIKDS